MVDYQTLIGDKVDSIPHILTDKKARELLTEHGSLKKYFGTKAGKKFWLANQAELVRNRTLVRLVATCVDDLELEADDLLVKQRDGKGIERATGVRLPKSFHALQSYCHTKQVNLFAK
jgi:5'-3' exonuclease